MVEGLPGLQERQGSTGRLSPLGSIFGPLLGHTLGIQGFFAHPIVHRCVAVSVQDIGGTSRPMILDGSVFHFQGDSFLKVLPSATLTHGYRVSDSCDFHLSRGGN